MKSRAISGRYFDKRVKNFQTMNDIDPYFTYDVLLRIVPIIRISESNHLRKLNITAI